MFFNDVRISRLPPGKIDARNIQTIDSGDFSKTVAERPYRNGKHVVAGRKNVGDGRLLPGCAGSRVGQHRRGGLEEILQTGGNPAHNGGKLWPAVVNHGIGHGLQDFLRNGHRPRDAQILRWNGLARLDLRDRDSFALSNGHLLLRLYRQNRPVMLRKNTSHNKKIRRITTALSAALLITLQTKYSIHRKPVSWGASASRSTRSPATVSCPSFSLHLCLCACVRLSVRLSNLTPLVSLWMHSLAIKPSPPVAISPSA